MNQAGDIWDEELFSAIKRGYMTIVQRMLARRLDPVASHSLNPMPLNLAIQLNRVDIVTALIAHGSDINDAREGYTPLYHAVWESEEMTRLLLSAGADPNSKGDGEYPLAALGRRMELRHEVDGIAHALLKAGANPNVIYGRESILESASRNKYDRVAEDLVAYGAVESNQARLDINNFSLAEAARQTPLHLAARFGKLDLVRAIIEQGADLEAGDDYRKTPLMFAVESHAPEVVRFLIEAGANPGAVDQHKRSVLWHAVNDFNIVQTQNSQDKAESLLILRMLLETGVLDQEPEDNVREHAFDVAVLEGSTDVVRLFLEFGADPDRDYHGEPFAAFAARLGKFEMFMALVDAGAEVYWDTPVRTYTAGEIDSTVFVNTAASGAVELIDYFLKSGAATSDQSKVHLDRALSAAAGSGSVASVKLLLSAGATIQPPSDSQSTYMRYTAVQNAVRIGDIAVLRVLLEAGLPPGEALYEAAHYGDIELVQWLLDRGIDVNAPNHDGMTALMAAHWTVGQQANEELVDLLLDLGADVNIVDKYGSTALNNATRSADAMRTLLAAGADPNIGFDGTPLMRAVQYGSDESVDLLLEAGADVNAVTKDGNTAWRMAQLQGDDEIAEKMLALGARESATATEQLHAAILWGKTEDALRLIREGSDLTALDIHRYSPLVAAIGYGSNISIIEALLQNGADHSGAFGFDSLDSLTPLESAINMGRLDIVGLLLRYGADGGGTASGKAPISHACSHVENVEQTERGLYVDMVRLLLDAGASPNVDDGGPGLTPLQEAARANDVELMGLLLENGADLEMSSGSEYMPAHTALAEAVWALQEESVRYLVDRGSIIDAENASRETPLNYVCDPLLARTDKETYALTGMKPDEPDPDKEARILRIAQLLIEYGADVNHRNRYGRTPLHGACDRMLVHGVNDSLNLFTADRLALIQLLINSGADASIEDEWGWTPLSLAKRAGAQDVLDILAQSE